MSKRKEEEKEYGDTIYNKKQRLLYRHPVKCESCIHSTVNLLVLFCTHTICTGCVIMCGTAACNNHYCPKCIEETDDGTGPVICDICKGCTASCCRSRNPISDCAECHTDDVEEHIETRGCGICGGCYLLCYTCFGKQLYGRELVCGNCREVLCTGCGTHLDRNIITNKADDSKDMDPTIKVPDETTDVCKSPNCKAKFEAILKEQVTHIKPIINIILNEYLTDLGLVIPFIFGQPPIAVATTV